MRNWLKLLAPWLAVAVFWFGFHSAWLALLAYHAQILFWARRERTRLTRLMLPANRGLLFALPAAAGPLLYFLLPHITRADLSEWMLNYGLSGWSLLVMIPYFGVVHPVLEQVHWSPLRRETPAAHLLFAGYHLLVLYSILQLPWALFCVAVLAGISMSWKLMQTKGMSGVVLSHIAGDLGVVLAVALLHWHR